MLETGIDSLTLKNSQYPLQYRPATPTSRLLDYLLVFSIVVYVLVTGVGVLIGFIFLNNPIFNRGYYIDDYIVDASPVTLKELTLHHICNLVMIVSILLKLIYLVYLNIMGRVVGSKIGVRIKDMEMITESSNIDVLVTTLGGDLVRSNTTPVRVAKREDSNALDDSPQKIPSNLMLHSIQVK